MTHRLGRRRMDMGMDMRIDMHTGMRMDMRIGMHMGMRMDMRIGMRTGMGVKVRWGRAAYRWRALGPRPSF